MALQGSITELQDTIIQLYIELQQRFKENQLIHDLFSEMAHDITQQKRSMTALPHSFWSQLKDDQDTFFREIAHARQQNIDKKEDTSLVSCFMRALKYEEPAILNVYVPIIRRLRENWTDQSLDFYIIVKAHLARIMRATRSYAGDPAVLQQSNLLLQQFEKEVQEPHSAPRVKQAKAPETAPVQAVEKHMAKPQKKPGAKQAQTLAKRSGNHHGRTKPLEKISLQRRRAHR